MIRFAILAGVSTEAQAQTDKLSIPDQIAFCRNIIKINQGIETVEPFVMDGYSRTGYDSLEVAMREIPPLGQAIQAAQDNQYDILIMDNYDRLGDLGFIVKTRFKKIRKQLHSARQSGKVTPPEQYDPYASEDADIAMFAQGIVQAYRINKLRRGWNIGVPDRARDGLHSLSIAYGYKTSSKGMPAQLIPHEAQAIIQIKDWYLQGINLKEICDRLDQMGIKPKRAQHWTRTVVRRTVTNPYYAGITIFGKYKTENKNRIPQPPSQWVRGKGQHIALWDEQTYFAILAEQDRRHSLRARGKYYALTGVLKCSICGTSVHRHGKQGTHFIYMNCSSAKTHIITRYDKLLPLVADAVITAIQTYKNDPAAIDSTEHITEKIHAQQTLRQRVQEGYEIGLYNQLEAQKKIVAAENEIERLTRARDRAAHQHRQKQAMLQFAEQDLNRMRAWIIEDDPATVNVFLTSLCENMIISPENQITVNFRT